MASVILLAPLVGALIAGFGWKLIRRTGGNVDDHGPPDPGARCLSWVGVSHPRRHDGAGHDPALDRKREPQHRLGDPPPDRLTAIMLVVINTVSALVHLYPIGYMAHDEKLPRRRALSRRASSPIFRSSHFAMLML